MNGTSGGQSPSTPEQAASYAALQSRNQLARIVTVGSFLTIFLLVGTLIAFAQGQGAANAEASRTAQNAFNAILPVLAGWVGTVLAFFFSAASQERTAVSLDKAIGQSAGGGGSQVLVSAKMIPTDSILELQKLDDDKNRPEDIKLSTLQDLFNKKQANGSSITRLIFVQNSIFRYIMHSSELNKFLVSASSTTPASPLQDLTFAQMIANQTMLNQISKLVAFVSAAAKLADAKSATEAVPGAQDIIVTATGNASAPMLGWLSNVDLIKALTAS